MAIRKLSNSSIITGTKSSKFWDQETFPGYFESIATIIVGSAGQSTISFSNIPQNYAHLQLRWFGKTDRAAGLNSPYIRFNNISSSSYWWHGLYGDGATAYTEVSNGADTGVIIERFTGNTGATNIFGAGVIDILDYTNTNKYKTVRSLAGADLNGSGQMTLSSGVWNSTNAITRIDFVQGYSATNFLQYTHIALYGIRGA